MDTDDNQEVEQMLEVFEPPVSPTTHRDQWLLSSEPSILSDFLSNQTVRKITSYQFHSSSMQMNASSWELGGIALHTVEFT